MTDRTTARRWAIVGWGLFLACAALAPALYHIDATGWGDWGWFHHSWEVGRVALLRWGEAPLWDPHHCGGVSTWGQPQAQMFAPTWWITGLPFGTVVGHKLFILLHFVVGFAGVITLGRRIYGMSTPAAALAAVAWAFSGWFGWRAGGGHATFLAFHYLPWVLYCWRRAHEMPRYNAPVALLMALILFEGGTYAFPFTFLVLLFDTVVVLAPPRPKWTVFRTAAVAGGLTLLVGAARLWPIFRTMSRYPRETQLEDAQTWRNVVESLTAREPHPWHWGHRWVWAEYSAYIGYAVMALAAYGAVVALRRGKHWPLILGALLFGAFSMGNVDAHWPWPLLHELPMFGNFHVPSRFHVLLTFYLALLAGLAVDRALRGVRRGTARRGTQEAVVALAWLLVAGVAIEVVSNDVRIAARWSNPPIEGEPAESLYLVGPAGYLEQYMAYPQRNLGTIACYDPVPWEVSPALWVGDVPQLRLDPPGAGQIEGFERTNHTFVAELALSAPARVVVNQNFDPDWRLSVGEPVEDRGRLAVDLPQGEHRLVGTYAPPDLPWSVLLSVLGLLLSAVVWWRWRSTPLPHARGRVGVGDGDHLQPGLPTARSLPPAPSREREGESGARRR